MKYISFNALFYIILLSGCLDTEGILELKGKVLDENTNVTISNRKIIIQALVNNDDMFISSYAGYFFTDSSGCFTYALKKVKNVYWYNFNVVGDTSYSFSNHKFSLMELNNDSKFLYLYLAKLAALTIKINRISKIPDYDTLYISWESNGIDGKTLYPYEVKNNWLNSKGLFWIGGEVKSVIKTKVFADKNTILSWELFRDGKYKEFIDTIFCKRDAANIVYFNY